jgi:carbamoyltransferase
MTYVLGITDGDDAGAVLLADGRIIAAVNEERLNRMKLSIGFPRLAVEEVLRLGNVKQGEIGRVAMAAHIEKWVSSSQPNKGWFQRASKVDRIRNRAASALAKPLANVPGAYRGYMMLKRLSFGRRRANVERTLREMGIAAPVSYHVHHLCHALSAHDASGYSESLSVSLDGGGDGACSNVCDMNSKQYALLNKIESVHSIGNFYAYVTHLCGFRANIHEGKITGLAAHGEPRFIDMFRKLVAYEDGQIRNVGKVYQESALSTLKRMLPPDWTREDLAASIQLHLEEVVVPYVQYWLRRSGRRNLCLSGGVFANVRLNQKLAELPECDSVFVFPAMGDGGLAAGAAFDAWRELCGGGHDPQGTFMSDAYLGPSYSDADIEAELSRAGVPYTQHADIESVIARLLAEKRVVARFDGRMEYGPRALGARTIMYHPGDPSVNDWLNKRLNRTEFMPFAPACLAGRERELFAWNDAAARAARFMTITQDCTKWMKERCAAVVHVDGTARPQIVDKETNPSFHRTIEKFNELTGIPVVVNTSFNMHEEPIVCSPYDAVRAYQLGRLDNLAIGSFLLGDPPKAASIN